MEDDDPHQPQLPWLTSKVKGQGQKLTWSVWAMLTQWPRNRKWIVAVSLNLAGGYPMTKVTGRLTQTHKMCRIFRTSHLCLLLIRETKCCTFVIRGRRGHTVSAEPGGHTSCYFTDDIDCCLCEQILQKQRSQLRRLIHWIWHTMYILVSCFSHLLYSWGSALHSSLVL